MAPVLVSSIPTLSNLYKDGTINPVAGAADGEFPEPSSSLNSKISLIRTSITTLATTSIVNAANTSLLGGGGVDGAIHSAAGPSLYDECLTLNGCSTGSAKLTSGHGLPCKYIIHAVGPIYQRAKRESPSRPAELLTSCYRTSLELAAAKGGSIAFSCLSTGVYGYPSGEAAKAAIGEVRRWLEEEEAKGRQRLDRVVFCCFEAKDDRVYKEWLPKIFPPTESELSTALNSAETSEAPALESSVVSALSANELASKKHKNDTEDLDKGWEAVENPSVAPSEKNTDLSEEGEKVEAPSEKVTELTEEGEKVEAPDLSKDDGEKVEQSELEASAAEWPQKSTLLKDW